MKRHLTRRAGVALAMVLATLLLGLGTVPTARAAGAATISGTLVTVNNSPGDQTQPHVSGDWVSYTDNSGSNGQIRYHNLVSGVDAAIPNNGADDDLSDIAGNTIVYRHISATDQPIFAYDISTGQSLGELDPQAGSLRSYPSIGNRTVAWADFTADTSHPQIQVYNLDTQTTWQLTSDGFSNIRPGVSPDGSLIVWAKCALSLQTGCHIWQATFSGGVWTTKQLTSGAGDDQTPDTNGQVVAYSSARSGVQNIYWQPVGGGTEHEIAPPPGTGITINPHVSANLVSFENYDTTTGFQHFDIWVYNLTTNTLSRVTDDLLNEGLSDLSVTPDGVARLVWSVPDTGDYNVYAFIFQPDTTPPVLSLPATITTNATSPAGAVVTYTASATDDDGTNPAVSCTPASGSTFAIGTTTVSCSATDKAGNTAMGSFQVIVKGAGQQVSDLVSLVNSFHLAQGLQTSLDTKLQAALTAVNAGDSATACSDLTDFISQVKAQSGKGLTVSQANQLIAAANQIKAALGC